MMTDLIYASLIKRMTEYFRGDTKRIQHFLKVHSLTETIALLEGVDADTLHILKTAAIVHDIGVKNCKEKYGDCSGKRQEKEGSESARRMLTELAYDDETIDRVCWLIAHHHTYDEIHDLDHRILVEADLLINMCEDGIDKAQISMIYYPVFQTPSGRALCCDLFGIEDPCMVSTPSDDRSGSLDNKEEPEADQMQKASTVFQAANISPAYMVSSKCNGCGTCVDVCPAGCIDARRTPAYIHQEKCLHCGSCASVCDKKAIISFKK